MDDYPNFRLATGEDLLEDFGPERFGIGFPIRPLVEDDHDPPTPLEESDDR